MCSVSLLLRKREEHFCIHIVRVCIMFDDVCDTVHGIY